MRILLLIALAASTVAAQSRDEAEAKLKARINKTAPGAEPKISVGESASGPMLVAEIGTGEKRQVLIERFVRADEPARASLRLITVLKQTVPVLDFAYAGDTLVVLEPDRVVHGGRPIPFSPAVPVPRDPRGRLLLRDGAVDIRLPGFACSGSAALVCKPDSSTWREGMLDVAWVKGRNQLTTVGGATVESVASLPGDSTVVTSQTSEIAAIRTACAASAMIEAAGTELRAVEIRAGNPPLTDTLSLSGPVTALWTSANPAEVSIVVKNRRTGEYEASRLSVDCGR